MVFRSAEPGDPFAVLRVLELGLRRRHEHHLCMRHVASVGGRQLHAQWRKQFVRPGPERHHRILGIDRSLVGVDAPVQAEIRAAATPLLARQS